MGFFDDVERDVIVAVVVSADDEDAPGGGVYVTEASATERAVVVDGKGGLPAELIDKGSVGWRIVGGHGMSPVVGFGAGPWMDRATAEPAATRPDGKAGGHRGPPLPDGWTRRGSGRAGVCRRS